MGVPLVQEGQPYVREVCLEEHMRHQDGSAALEAAEAHELECFQGEEEWLKPDPESYMVTLEVNVELR